MEIGKSIFNRMALAITLIALLGMAGSIRALEPDTRVARLIESIAAENLLDHVDTLVDFGTRRSSQPQGRAAQDHIEAFLSGLDLDEVTLQDFDSGADNVLGVLRGSQHPERIHILGAHYDSTNPDGPTWPAPGADDNASGTAAVLEAARVIAESGYRPAETIIFAAFSAEEDGLRGSKAYVDDLKRRGETAVDMICLDVIGYVKPGTEPDLSVSSYSFGSGIFTPEINALLALIGDVAAAYLPDWPAEIGPGCG